MSESNDENRICLRDYWKSLKPVEKTRLAEAMDTSLIYLGQVASGGKKASKWFMIVLQQITGEKFIHTKPEKEEEKSRKIFTKISI